MTWITLDFVQRTGDLESLWIAIASAVAIANLCKRTLLSPSNGFGFGLRYVSPQPFQFANSLGQVFWAFERLTTFHGDLSSNRSSSDEFIILVGAIASCLAATTPSRTMVTWGSSVARLPPT